MIFDFTEAELKEVERIKKNYAPKIEELQALIDNNRGNKEVYQEAAKQFVTIENTLQAELDSYSLKCQQERFAPILQAGTDAIIENAKEQTELVLQYLHNDLNNTYKGIKPEYIKKDLSATKQGIYKDGSVYIGANYAFYWAKDELRLHIEALNDNREALQRLMEAVIEIIETSKHTDNSNITDKEQKTLKVNRFRRSPLKDISVYGIMNDKVNAHMMQDTGIFTMKADGQMKYLFKTNQAGKNELAEIPVTIALTFEGENISLSKKLNGYDSAVYNAVADLYHNWKEEHPSEPLYLSPQEVWRRMNGKSTRDGQAKPSQNQLNKIRASMSKMRHIDFYMDIKAEVEANRINFDDDDRFNGYYIKDYLLNSAEAGYTTEQGRYIPDGFRINCEPILYTYNAKKKHILKLPFNLLDISGALSDSENVTEFRQYLIQQILLMHNGQRQSCRILLSTVYEATGVLPPEERIKSDYANKETWQQAIRRARKADREKIEALLNLWKTKEYNGHAFVSDFMPLNDKGLQASGNQIITAYDIRI